MQALIGSWTNIWTLSGNQGNQWLELEENLNALNGQLVQFRISATTGSSFRSDAGIDDFFINPVPPNDAGIASIDQPAIAFSPGNLTVAATVQNFGSNNLSTATIGWSVDGLVQTAVPATFSPSVPQGGLSNSVTLGSFPFLANLVEVCVWTEMPNGSTDGNTANDTLCQTHCQGLSGTYTLGLGGDFADFAALQFSLNNCGLSGPTLVNVMPGLYNEKIELIEVSGASSTNTITIDGGDSSLVRLHGNIGPTIWLNGIDHIHIKNMTISTAGTNDSYCIQLRDQAESNSVDKCLLLMDDKAFNLSDVVGISASNVISSSSSEGQNAIDFLCSNSTIIGGEKSIHFEGQNNNRTSGNQFINNQLINPEDYGFYIDDQDGLVIRGNTITGVRNASGDGIYCFDIMDFDISENIVMNTPDWACHVADGNYSPDGTPSQRGKIINNIFTSNSDYGLYVDDIEQTDIFHNTIYTTGNPIGAFRVNDFNQMDIRNNIFVSLNGRAFRSDEPVTNGSNTLDNNLYHSINGSTLVFHGGFNYSDLASWQTANPSINQQSVEGDPVFVDAGSDLTPLGPLANDAGDNTVGIPFHVFGNARPQAPSTVVDMGAIEFSTRNVDLCLLDWYRLNSIPCGDSTHYFSLIIRNVGLQNISGFQLDAQLSGDINQTVSQSYSGSLDFDERDTVELGPFNTAGGINALLSGTATVIGDEDPVNNGLPAEPLEIIPLTPQISTKNGCSGDTVVFEGLALGRASYSWYDSPSSTTPLAISDSFKVAATSSQTTFYVEYADTEGSITTTFAENNGCGGGNMFDVTAFSAINITGWEGNLDVQNGVSTTVNIYYKEGTYDGFQGNASAWTLLGSATVISNGNLAPTYVDVGNDLNIPAGETYGIFFNAVVRYTNGSNVYSNSDLSISTGIGLCGSFSGFNIPRTWNGTIHYGFDACSDIRVPVTANFNAYEQLAQQNCGNCGQIRINYCQYEPLPLSLNEVVAQNSNYVPGAELVWYDDNSGSPGALYQGTGEEPPVPNLNSTSTKFYWVLQSNGTAVCESPLRRVRVRVKKTFIPTFSLNIPGVVCGSSQIDLATGVGDPKNKATGYTFYHENPQLNPLAMPIAHVSATAGVVNPNQYALATVSAGANTFWVQSTVPNGCGGVASANITAGTMADLDPVSDIVVNAGDLVDVIFTSSNASFIFWFDHVSFGNPNIGQPGAFGISRLMFTAQNSGSTPLVARFRAVAYYNNCAGQIRDFYVTVNPGPGSRQVPNNLQLAASLLNAHDVRINWQLQYEFELSHIELEKLNAKGDWVKIASSQQTNDFHIDREGFEAEARYRLKLVHPDGRAVWTREARVKNELGIAAPSFHLYPNPSSGRFSLIASTELQGSWKYQLSDQLGRNMASGELKGLETHFDIANQPADHYHLLVISPEGKRYFHKLVKQ